MTAGKELAKVIKSKYFYLALIILIIGVFINTTSGIFLFNEKENLPVMHDIILDNLPLFKAAYIYNLFSFSIFVLLVVYTIKNKKYNEIPYFIILFGIFYTIRGAFLILTPFGNPVPDYNTIMEKLKMFRVGMYPSGHTGSSFLTFLLVKGKYRYLTGILCVFVVVLLLLAKQHYSIDIFSALVFAYAIHSFGKKYLSQFKI